MTIIGLEDLSYHLRDVSRRALNIRTALFLSVILQLVSQLLFGLTGVFSQMQNYIGTCDSSMSGYNIAASICLILYLVLGIIGLII